MKGDGGAVGLTENTSELLRWIVSGPRVISEFQSTQELTKLSADQIEKDVRHHEEVKGVRKNLQRKLKICVQPLKRWAIHSKKSVKIFWFWTSVTY